MTNYSVIDMFFIVYDNINNNFKEFSKITILYNTRSI